MRSKLFVLTLVTAALAVPAAGAHPGPGKGKPEKTGANCRPKVSVILKGTLAEDPAADSFMLTVKKSNKHGRGYGKATQPVKVLVTADTKIKLSGHKGPAKLSDLKKDYRANVQARLCKADLKDGATPELTAKRVAAHAPKAPKPSSSESSESGS